MFVGSLWSSLVGSTFSITSNHLYLRCPDAVAALLEVHSSEDAGPHIVTVAVSVEVPFEREASVAGMLLKGTVHTFVKLQEDSGGQRG